jgi:dTDP-4-dehydrorhamnose reductase
MTKVYATGAAGKVGKYLVARGATPFHADITKPWEIEDEMSGEKPDIVLHLAGISDVDFCEKKSNQDKVILVNLRGTYNLVSIANSRNIPVVLLSTDHVFPNRGMFSWKPYNEKATPNPVNFYGQSKLAAEGLRFSFDNMKVIRTSFLFDKERLDAIADQSAPDFITRSFMYIPHFVDALLSYVNAFSVMPSLMHIAGSRTISWYKLMGEYLCDVDIPFHSTEMPGHAPRPYRGGLSTIYKLLPEYSYLDGIREIHNGKQAASA